MKVTILHLSDIHFRSNTKNPILSRIQKLVASVIADAPSTQVMFVVLSGDIAFSGTKEEYSIASDFLARLREELAALADLKQIFALAVPGNHDCDFSRAKDTRKFLINGLTSSLESSISSEVFDHLTEVQNNFFDFRETLNHERFDRLCCTEEFTIDRETFQFHLYNTSFMSQINEQQGALLFPVSIAEEHIKFNSEAALSISILHHPFNWLDANNEVVFSQHVKNTSDLVLTGHQHTSKGVLQHDVFSGEKVAHFRSDALQGSNASESGFNTIIFDGLKSPAKVVQYRWRDGSYSRSGSCEVDLVRVNASARGTILSNPQYVSYLQDCGIAFSHPRKKALQLHDVFVYPDLSRRLSNSGDEESRGSVIRSRDVLEFLCSQSHFYIIGGFQSGKTALGKTLYRDLQKHQFVPLMFAGGQIRHPRQLEDLIEEQFAAQYNKKQFTNFEQLRPSQKAVIIDDLQNSRAARGPLLNELVRELSNRFGKVILIGDEILEYQQLAAAEPLGDNLADFEQLKIMEFGHVLRGQLVDRWQLLGSDPTDYKELPQNTAETERLLSTVIGKNLLPSHPIVILAILQIWEAAKSSNAAASSYGHLYEALITASLGIASKSPHEIDTNYTILTKLAFTMFRSEQSSFSLDRIFEIVRDYNDEYGMQINAEDLVGSLCRVNLLWEIDGVFRFRYRYAYYYFVARYFKSNMGDTAEGVELRARLKEMAEYVSLDEYTNILLFVLYLTKDSDVIEHLINQADHIFSEYEPCDMQDDVRSFNQVHNAPIESFVLPTTTSQENREEARQQRELDDIELSREEAKIRYSADLDGATKLNFAFKTLQILGQVIRDSPGSLKADLKLKVAKSVYLLGLRTLQSVLSNAQDNIDELRSWAQEIIRGHRSYDTPRDLALAADALVTNIAKACAFGIVKRISFAVGLKELARTYAELLRTEGQLASIKLVDLSIKLDHFRVYPLPDIEEMANIFRRNPFGSAVLRKIVVDHMLVYELGRENRQKVGTLLGLRINAPAILEGDKKRK